MREAEQVVDALLEAVAVCANCQRELGIPSGADETHGICKRHATEYYVDMFNGDRERAVHHLASKPESNFAPDMAQQKAA